MNKLPVTKIIIASFAFAFTNGKKILQISILPIILCLPLLSVLPDLLALTEQLFNLDNKEIANIKLPENALIYLFLFLYAYVVLSIKIYQLTIFGDNFKASIIPIVDFNKIIRFITLTLVIGFITIIPVIITRTPILQLIVYFLIIPLTLNFINISIDRAPKYKWNLSMINRLNLFLLQVIFPILVVALFTMFGGFSELVGRVIMFYFGLISLALFYKLIDSSN